MVLVTDGFFLLVKICPAALTDNFGNWKAVIGWSLEVYQKL